MKVNTNSNRPSKMEARLMQGRRFRAKLAGDCPPIWWCPAQDRRRDAERNFPMMKVDRHGFAEARGRAPAWMPPMTPTRVCREITTLRNRLPKWCSRRP